MAQAIGAAIAALFFGLLYALWNLFCKYVIKKEKYVHKIGYEKFLHIDDDKVEVYCFDAWIKVNGEKFYYHQVCTARVVDDEFLQKILAEVKTDQPVRFYSDEREDLEYYAEYTDGKITRYCK